MTNTVQWLQEFDKHKGDFEWFHIEYGFENEWKKLLEARRRNQIKTMKAIMKQVLWDAPEAFITPAAEPVGREAFINLIEVQ